MSINYTYTYLNAEYTGWDALTFQVAGPETEDNAGGDRSRRMVIFEGANITDAEVVAGSPGGDRLAVDRAGGTVSLDMADAGPGEPVTVEVALNMDGRAHKVTVIVTAEAQGNGVEAQNAASATRIGP